MQNCRAFGAAAFASLLAATSTLLAAGDVDETRVLADRELDAAGAVGTLVLQGGGDPAVNNEDWWQIADRLDARGVKHSGPVDRGFMDSIYFRDPDGNLLSLVEDPTR